MSDLILCILSHTLSSIDSDWVTLCKTLYFYLHTVYFSLVVTTKTLVSKTLTREKGMPGVFVGVTHVSKWGKEYYPIKLAILSRYIIQDGRIRV